jgi:hypothetical protein
MDQKFVLALARRIENVVEVIASMFNLPKGVSFAYYHNDAGKVIGMDVKIESAAEISSKIPEISHWDPRTVETNLLPILDELAMV